MRHSLRILTLGLVWVALSSCASLHSVSLTSIPRQRHDTVHASVSKFVFLAFNFDNEFVNELSERLRGQCQGGKVTGILTKHYTISYILAHQIVVKAQGFCVKGR